MDKIVFIDVDGPLAWGTWGDGRVRLNSGSKDFTIPYPWVQEDCEALDKILDETGARMVLSSDWRRHFSFFQMRRVFEYYQVNSYSLIDFTTQRDLWNRMSRPSAEWERAAEIIKWVKDNKVKKWIAIDDMNLGREFKFMKVPKYRHVQVDGDFGVGGRLRDKVEECINKLNK